MSRELESIYYMKLGEIPYRPDREWTDEELFEALEKNTPVDVLFFKEKDYEGDKIRKLLKEYGAPENEIENFMNDLNDDFNYLDYIDKLKLTEKGKDIIAKAPELKKDELKKLILDYLKEEE